MSVELEEARDGWSEKKQDGFLAIDRSRGVFKSSESSRQEVTPAKPPTDREEACMSPLL